MVILIISGCIICIPLAFIIFLAICSLFINSKKEYEVHSNFYRALLNISSTAALKIMRVRIHLEGIESIPTDTRNLLFVGNHISNFDPIVSWVVLKAWKPAFVSKGENFRIPIFGRIIRKCCFMKIDRENPRNAIATINKAAELLKKGDVSVGIYPEGTRSKSCVLLPFHNGVFKIAQKADAQIVVMYICGTEKVHKNFPLHHTDVYFKVLDVIDAVKVKNTKTDLLGEHIKALMESEKGEH